MNDGAIQKSRMRLEIDEIPAAVKRLLSKGATTATAIAARIRDVDPVFVATIARGSSDHACGFLKYAIELETGLPVASLGPSVASVYGRQMRMARSLTIAVSQSGKSPDIVAMADNAKRGGSLVVALTNNAESPLAASSDFPMDICAGPELSVAATKSFVNSAVAGLMILAGWTGNVPLRQALASLPDALEKAVSCDWTALLGALEGKSSLYILGRGPALPIAAEAALKFKETSGMHAEAYSAAEVLHGPVSIVGSGFPVLAFSLPDQSEPHVLEVCRKIAGQGASVFIAGAAIEGATSLPIVSTGHALTDTLTRIASFYGLVETLSRHRGLNPDQPRHLRKVTETI
ncbi:MAG: SIS domain-containing protein [Rhizobiaceae bacterium]